MTDLEKRPPNIIDIEASGFADMAYPIEIGVALNSGKTYCSLVQPRPDWTYWDEAAEKVHRVPRDILELYGKPIEQITDELNELLRGQVAYSDGWEVDHPWLMQLFNAAGQWPEFRFSTLEFILSEDQMQVWHQVKDQILAEKEKQRHRASFDAQIIQQTFLRSRS